MAGCPYNLRSKNRKVVKSSRFDDSRAVPVPEKPKHFFFEEAEELDRMSPSERKKALERRGRLLGPPPEVVTEESIKEYEYQNNRLATLALAYFNTFNHCAYELVRTLESTAFMISYSIIMHTNFEAQLKTDPDAPVEVFFAEVGVWKSVWKVNRCSNLGTVKHVANMELFLGCVCSDEGITHPMDGQFHTGLSRERAERIIKRRRQKLLKKTGK